MSPPLFRSPPRRRPSQAGQDCRRRHEAQIVQSGDTSHARATPQPNSQHREARRRGYRVSPAARPHPYIHRRHGSPPEASTTTLRDRDATRPRARTSAPHQPFPDPPLGPEEGARNARPPPSSARALPGRFLRRRRGREDSVGGEELGVGVAPESPLARATQGER
jgi:hypothetical protein